MAVPFGTWLAEKRNQRGHTLRGLAVKAGISHATISKIEDGKVGASRDMVRTLADALEIPRAEAVHAWLEDDSQEGGAITYVTDPEEAGVVETYSGLNEVNREIARAMLEKLRDAQRRGTIGGTDTDRPGDELD